MSRDLSCKYHPDREGKYKCEKCRAPICLECMEKVNVLRRAYGEDSSWVTDIAEMCFPCSCDERKTHPAQLMIIAIFVTFMILILTFFTQYILLVLPILYIGLAVGWMFVKKQNEELEVKKQNFLSSHPLLGTISEVEAEKAVLAAKVVCPYCGAEIEEDATSCENCLEEFKTCTVCNLPILELDNITKTPCCKTYAHRNHLNEWLKIKGKCPNCGEKLEEWETP